MTHDQATCRYCVSAAKEGWWGAQIIHCEDCGFTWTGAAKQHCATCHRTFGSPSSAAQAHRYLATGIRCYDPAEKGLTLDPKGIWRRPAPPQSAHPERRSGEEGPS